MLEHYITSLPLCQGVFQKFFNFFVIFCPAAFLRFYPLVDSLHIIALLFSFVKHFLTSFSCLEIWAIQHISEYHYCAICTCLIVPHHSPSPSHNSPTRLFHTAPSAPIKYMKPFSPGTKNIPFISSSVLLTFSSFCAIMCIVHQRRLL